MNAAQPREAGHVEVAEGGGVVKECVLEEGRSVIVGDVGLEGEGDEAR